MVFMESHRACASTSDPSENLTPSFNFISQVSSSFCSIESTIRETRLPSLSCMKIVSLTPSAVRDHALLPLWTGSTVSITLVFPITIASSSAAITAAGTASAATHPRTAKRAFLCFIDNILLGYKIRIKKLYVCRIQAHSLKAYEFPGYARSYLSQTMTRSLKNTFESSRSSGSGIITPGSLPNFSVTYLPGIHPYSNGIAQDFHLFPF